MLFLLFSIRQRYKFESKSQLSERNRLRDLYCFRYVKDTNLKANHNYGLQHFSESRLFPIRQRYKFESKSQLYCIYDTDSPNCFRYVKDTN